MPSFAWLRSSPPRRSGRLQGTTSGRVVGHSPRYRNSRKATVLRRAARVADAGDCESGVREGKRGVAGQSARALPMQPPKQKRPAVSVRLIAGATVALVDHARAERPGLDQVQRNAVGDGWQERRAATDGIA